MTRHIDTAEVAKMARKVLQARFPAVRFSVRSKRYAGGSSIDVSWTDGPTRKLVESAVGKYHGAEFDGMIDLKSHHDTEIDGERVRLGNDYIFCHRDYSPAFVARVATEAEKVLGCELPHNMDAAANVIVRQLGNEYASTIIYRYAEDRTFYGRRAEQAQLQLVR